MFRADGGIQNWGFGRARHGAAAGGSVWERSSRLPRKGLGN